MKSFPQALPLGTELGNFNIRAVIGQGGGGFAYLCYDTLLEREVVLKEHFPMGLCRRTPQGEVLPTEGNEDSFEQSLTLFLQEARTLAAFCHPGIVRILEVLPSHGTAVAVMETVHGERLDIYLSSHSHAATVEKLLRLLLEILAFLHTHEVIHRDIKPANIVVQADGHPVLLDFGAALRGETKGERTIIGTPTYAAPEQFDVNGRIGPWSDLYALGMCFLHELGAEHVSRLPSRLRSSLYRATSKDPAQRFSEAAEWQQALSVPLRRYAVIVSAVLLLGGGCIALATWLNTKEKRPTNAPAVCPPAEQQEQQRPCTSAPPPIPFPDALNGCWFALIPDSGHPVLFRFEDDTHYICHGKQVGSYRFERTAPNQARLELQPAQEQEIIFTLTFDSEHHGLAQRSHHLPEEFQLAAFGTSPTGSILRNSLKPEEYGK